MTSKKLLLPLLLCSLGAVFAPAAVAIGDAGQTKEAKALHSSFAADAVTGDWMVNTGDAVVRIYEENGEYRGRVVWAGRESTDWWETDPPMDIPWDSKREAKRLKHAANLGVDILVGLRFNGSDSWTDGRVFNVLNGKIYRCQLSVPSPDVLKLKGYIGIPLFGGSVEWHRLTEAQKADMPSFPNRFQFPDTWP